MGKKKIAVLFGGMSTEHSVSCVSATSVIKGLNKDKYDVIPVGLAENGDWLPYSGEYDNIKNGTWEEDARKKNNVPFTEEGCIMEPGIKAIRECDIVFPVLHGAGGEDGTVQGLLELMKKPYVGCGVLASAVGMDKAYTKVVVAEKGIPQAKHVVAHREDILKDKNCYTQEISEKLGFPCFVKPANSGSSVGVFKVGTKEELPDILQEAQKYDRKIIVEEFIDGREIECAVMGNAEPKAATPGEIKPSAEFYDFVDKYKSGSSITVIPAEIPQEKLEEVRSNALKIYKALDCSGLSRVDFFYERNTGRIIFNEINTLPGFTDISMYSKLWAAEGVDFSEILDRLIDYGFMRIQENERIVSK